MFKKYREFTFCGRNNWRWDCENMKNWTITNEPITCRTCLRLLGMIEYKLIIIEH